MKQLVWLIILVVHIPIWAMAGQTSLTVAIEQEPTHLDPTKGAEATVDDILYANLFQGLTKINEFGTVQPALAESWAVSEGGLVYDFKVRNDVTFHNGIALTPDIVKWSLDRILHEESLNAQKGLFEPIDSVAITDNGGIQIKLKRPDGAMLWKLGWGDAVIVEPSSAAQNESHPIGTGPFEFSEWSKGSHVDLKAFPGFWGTPARIQDLRFRFLPNPADQAAALIAKEVDLVPNLSAPEMAVRFENDPDYEVLTGETEGETLLVLNQHKDVFKDHNVRVALTHAINGEEIIKGAMFGYGTPIGTHFAPQHLAYLDLNSLYPYDPIRAKALLEQAGIDKSQIFVLKVPPFNYARRSADIIAAQLEAVGLTIRIEPVDWASWLSDVFSGEYDFDFTIVSHTEPMDIGIYGRKDYYFGYHSASFDKTLAKLDLEADPDKRNRLFTDMQRILALDAANVFLFQLPKVAVHRAGLRGVWRHAPIQANDMTNAFWSD